MLALTLILIGQLPPAMPPLPTESLRVAQSAIHAAQLVVTTPGGDSEQAAASHAAGKVLPAPSPGLLGRNQSAHRVIQNTPAAFVSLPSPQARSQSCAGGFCNQPAMPTRRYAVPAQPVRRIFNGRVFGRRG